MRNKNFVRATMLTLAASLTALVATVAAAGASTTSYPVSYNAASLMFNGYLNPNTSPAGSNNYSCVPSTAHPYPVVLVHGTVENMNQNWGTISPVLANAGYCVFALNYGGSGSFQGTGEIAASAAELSTFIDKVLAATHTSKVDIVGHSQGGMMPRYYLKNLGGASKVHQLVGLVPSNHGTTASGLANLPFASQFSSLVGASLAEQTQGSSFLTALNAGGDTVPGVQYTVITTTHDEVVTPYTSAELTGSNVTNIVIQTACPNDTVGHLGMSFDSYAVQLVLNALDPSTAKTAACTSGFGL